MWDVKTSLATVALFLATGCVHGTFTAGSGASYTHKMVLSENKYEVYWKYDTETITFEVEVSTTGWVGFGLSPKGGMTRADIVIGGVNDDGTTYFTDRYAAENGPPSVDSEQNYELLHSSQTESQTVLRFKRKLDTCDDEDMLITSDTMRLIWTYGATDKVAYHGNSATARGTRSALLLMFANPPQQMPTDAIHWDLLIDKVNVPGRDTTYWCKGFNVPSLPSKHHVLKYEPVITPGNEATVHHIAVYGCYGDDVNTTGAHLRNEEDCSLMPNNLPYHCQTIVFIWTIGGSAFEFPLKIGMPFGDALQPKFLLMQMHYDNPALATDLVDSSGLRITLSPTLRQYDAGLLTTGLMMSPFQAIPPNQPSFTTYGYCSGVCTKEVLAEQPEGIKVFGGLLHAHLLGRALRLRHVRNGVELKPLFEDNNYDFNYQEMITGHAEREILPGDSLQMECGLSSSGKDSFTYGGEGTNEEMCMTFLLYYPRVDFAVCMSSPNSLTTFLSAQGLQHTYDDKSSSLIITEGEFKGLDARTALERMTWTSDKTQQFETSMRDSPYMMFCGKNFNSIMNRDTFKNGVNITIPYQAPDRACGDQVTTPGPFNGVAVYTVNTVVLAFTLLLVLMNY